MTITEHAVRRYKQRVGKRTASKKRVVMQINRDLARDVKYKKKSKVKDHYILVTSRYQAVCYKHRVVTITGLNEDASNFKQTSSCDEELSLVA
ncbi:hypothetical protein P4493_10095 [Bacillus thuringiensis]|jgi:hypothetical protein|uniref:Transposase n=4 Tax=Bacillus thuringiensis TaxID=1428 RepID=A0AB35PB69_BACTU|nr:MULTISPECIES: hypothetical protein [Bacillus]AFQ30367.1 hypothetical protein BTF1_31337 [Bacillus thuringiensis HD-789]AJH02590.1 hypothetical protein AS86_6629 [Bacillus thuringiensis HD1002]AND28556.1 hypothetical protein ATN07_33130 [Bacillus thuringiensis serovar israelensis]EXL36762.1 hypothetical protein BG78_23365 [Bacillus thuringiensis serovar israelensis]KAA8486477.1 hypothetical protein FYW98_17785 [Bacillus thuringiensis]